ncbi:hypothetical protein V8F06_009039 [Rhypophila decipiens]
MNRPWGIITRQRKQLLFCRLAPCPAGGHFCTLPLIGSFHGSLFFLLGWKHSCLCGTHNVMILPTGPTLRVNVGQSVSRSLFVLSFIITCLGLPIASVEIPYSPSGKRPPSGPYPSPAVGYWRPVAEGIVSGSAMSPTSTPSIASLSSSSTLVNTDWYEYVLRRRYKDPEKLQGRLNDAFGVGCYRVRVKRDRWVLSVPRPMLPGELEEIEENVYHHY